MELRREVELDGHSVTVSLRTDISQTETGFELAGEVDFSDDANLQELRLSGDESWICTPSYLLDAESVSLSLFGRDQDAPIHLFITKIGVDNNPAVVEFPPVSLLKAAEICINDDIEWLPRQVTRVINADSVAECCIGFLSWLSPVIPYADYMMILERLAKINSSFRHELAQNTEKQLQQMLTGRNYNAEYTIESYEDLQRRISDFDELEPIRRLSTRVDVKRALSYALGEIESERGVEGVAEFSRVTEIPTHHPELLRPYQVDMILAVQLLEGDLAGINMTVENCLELQGNSPTDSYEDHKNTGIEANDFEEKEYHWKYALALADREYQLTLSAANYLYWTTFNSDEIGPSARSLQYQAAYEGFNNCGVDFMAQWAQFECRFQAGISHRIANMYDEAANSFLASYNTARGSDGKWPNELSKQCSRSIRNWAASIADGYRYDREHIRGITTIEAVINDLESGDMFSTDGIEHAVAQDLGRLRAKRQVLEMEKHLDASEYELALEAAGAVIRHYDEIGDTDSKEWAITKRKDIQAIIEETNGNLATAADFHRNIGNTGQLKRSARDWHVHRADICDAKQYALNREYDEAQTQLTRIRERTERLESEASALSVVLSAVITFEKGEQSNFHESLTQLPESNTERDHVMGLEYNYEDPLAVIHAAQWLRTYNVDPEVLSMAVEVALRASLIPLHAGDAAASVGLDDVSLRDQWLYQLPSAFAQRISGIRYDESMPQTDYVGLGSRLYHTLDAYLATYGEYYGTRKFGKSWISELSDGQKSEKLSFGDLTNVFKKCGEMLDCGSRVDELLIGRGKDDASVTSLRNDIDHARTDDIRYQEYELFRDRVFGIFQESAEESPLIASVVETRPRVGVDIVQLHWWNPQRRVFVRTDATLNEGCLYYFPKDQIVESIEMGEIRVPADTIVPIRTDKVSSKF